VPTEVDLLPFTKFVKTYQPSGTKTTPGSWLSVVQLLVELYDHQTGEIAFHQPSTFTPENLSQSSVKLSSQQSSIPAHDSARFERTPALRTRVYRDTAAASGATPSS
jgi:hypothetical protein